MLLALATVLVALRVPNYREDAALLDRRMTVEERELRDRVLESQDRRTELAVALFQRELRLKSLKENGVHLAINTADSTLSLRHGPATLRQIRIRVGPDSVIQAPDGRTWRMVRALGERHLVTKESSPAFVIPEWIYVSRNEPVPAEAERRIDEGLGKYVLRLDDGTDIYSEPPRGPFATKVKPASFVAPEAELSAIFEALQPDTPVYIY